MTPRVVVLDYGSGNLRSAQRALARVGADVEVTADADAALECDGLAVPGVGAFAACMAGLRAVGGDKLIARRLELGRPVLGICVGMQVLFAAGVEPGVRGSGTGRDCGPRAARPGRARWNGWTPACCRTWAGTPWRPPRARCSSPGSPPGTRFYFVHSYALRAAGAGDLAAAGALISWTEHGERFAAAVEQGVLSRDPVPPGEVRRRRRRAAVNWLGTL